MGAAESFILVGYFQGGSADAVVVQHLVNVLVIFGRECPVDEREERVSESSLVANRKMRPLLSPLAVPFPLGPHHYFPQYPPPPVTRTL